ncbi:MAG: hypothetical protein J6Y44_00675 [Clostridia bacterium]|nr:hypothetical protein [Clostridia bacterium]
MDRESRLKDIENKLSFLKTAVERSRTLFLTENDCVYSNDVFTFEAQTKLACHVEAKLSFTLTGETDQEFNVLIDGVYKSPYKSIIGENVYEFDCISNGGRLLIELEFEDGSCVKDLKLKLCGCVEREDFYSRINSVPFENCYVTGLKNGVKNLFSLYSHDDNEDREIFSVTCAVAAVAKLTATELICIYGDGENMNAKILTPNGEEVSSFTFSAQATSFCGGYHRHGGVFYGIERGEVNRFFFFPNHDLVVDFTGYYGKEVFASNLDEDRMVVIGFDGKAKLVIG